MKTNTSRKLDNNAIYQRTMWNDSLPFSTSEYLNHKDRSYGNIYRNRSKGTSAIGELTRETNINSAIINKNKTEIKQSLLPTIVYTNKKKDNIILKDNTSTRPDYIVIPKTINLTNDRTYGNIKLPSKIQPMTSECTRFTYIDNEQIYNFTKPLVNNTNELIKANQLAHTEKMTIPQHIKMVYTPLGEQCREPFHDDGTLESRIFATPPILPMHNNNIDNSTWTRTPKSSNPISSMILENDTTFYGRNNVIQNNSNIKISRKIKEEQPDAYTLSSLGTKAPRKPLVTENPIGINTTIHASSFDGAKTNCILPKEPILYTNIKG